jgi:hypothetical protein
MEPFTPSPLAVGALPVCYAELPGKDATVQDITVEFLGKEPSEEALGTIVFNSGSIRFINLHHYRCQSGDQVSEAAILQ